MVDRALLPPREFEAGEVAVLSIVGLAAGRAAVAERALARFDDRGIALARRRAVEIAHQHRRLARLALAVDPAADLTRAFLPRDLARSEEHTSELQSLMRISYAVFCLKKKKNNTNI